MTRDFTFKTVGFYVKAFSNSLAITCNLCLEPGSFELQTHLARVNQLLLNFQGYCKNISEHPMIEDMPLLLLAALLLAGCGDSVQPTPVPDQKQKVYEKNATDAVGVAEGDQKISPFGKPAH